MHFSARGLVLSARTVGEWDRSLTLLLEGIGRVSVWARGAKRIKSPLLAPCSPFAFSSFTLHQKGERVTVESAELTESFFELRNDVEALALAAWLTDLTATLCVERQPEDGLLRLILNALYALSRGKEAALVKPAFELRLLSEAGFLPELTGCLHCGEEPCAFSAAEGGVLCQRHALSRPDAVPLSPAVLAALRHLTQCDDRRLYAYRLPPPALAELTALAERYVIHTIGAEPQTLRFYRSMAVPPPQGDKS
ncbi:MAG: DNA repair protein RecO [Clostridia bacterium]|nr:DNA repair protein RecO [Clostridia bacterium]